MAEQVVPLEERMYYALRAAGLDETDADTALKAVLDTLDTTVQWRVVCAHGSTSRGSAEGARRDAAEIAIVCSARAHAETRRVIDRQPLGDWLRLDDSGAA